MMSLPAITVLHAILTLWACTTNAFQVQTGVSRTATTAPARRCNPSTLFSRQENKNSQKNDDDDDASMRLLEGTVSSRRNVLSQAAIGGAALASFLSQDNARPAFASAETNGSAAAAFTAVPKTIVVTGSNSGVGFEACKKLASRGGGHTIVLACRNMEKAQDAVDRILMASSSSDATTTVSGKLIPAACDLSDLASVQRFAKQLPSLLGGGNNAKLDALCLNAGLARNAAAEEIVRTKDGFELTVGVNHFGHFYLNSLLLPMMNPAGGKIVVTASSVHDPEGPGGAQGEKATLGKLQGLEQLGKDCEMIDGGAFNADKAYKDSKLCNVLFTRELQRRLSSSNDTNKVTASCFSPGLILESGFFRDQSPVFTKVFDFAASNLFKVTETSVYGGGCLAYMVNSVGEPGGQFYNSPPGTSSKYGESAYGSQFGPTTVSKEAMDDTKAKRLWELSEKVLGLA